MQFYPPQEESVQVLATSQQNPNHFLLKIFVNFVWLCIGLRVIWTANRFPALSYLPSMVIFLPAVYCMYRNWIKHYTCLQVYKDEIVLHYGKEKPPVFIPWSKLKEVVLKSKEMELKVRNDTYQMPIYSDYENVLDMMKKCYQEEMKKSLVILDRRKESGQYFKES